MHIYASLANELLFDFCLHHSKLVLVEIGLLWFSLCFNEVFGWFLHGHKQIIVGVFLFSTAPMILLSSLYITFNFAFLLRSSLLSILRIPEFHKHIPVNNAGLIGLIYYFQLSKTTGHS